MADFHDAFEAALGGDAAALKPWLPDTEAPGLKVYRNTIARGRAEVLAAAFPTVARLTGEDWFRAAALEFARAHPPGEPAMDRYGAGFPDWLAQFPPARDLPYLAPVARLDRAFSEAHAAPDAPVLDPAGAAVMDTAALYAARAELHPSARVFWFDWTVASIWLSERGFEPADTLAWTQQAEGVLVVRPQMTVTAVRLDRAQAAFLRACRDGATLGQAATKAFTADLAADLRSLFTALLRAGAFTRLHAQS
ncbi:MAG: DNA-binding domain-containing protein [Caulobacteraceae bacterium]|nr:DNA-binding domain-containing protein [Caulobacteraceae bacterium]